ncbi:MAG: hypothetical protein C4617_03845 [Candidatus Liberibacter europaeus]|uniref:DUF1376 domain-containing protein n=1 Tax=Candidatus Liberibacter europaeus TaxID=744859 RepID=A0A2T4VX37_9HYPH|nr:hypothetical protein [Candidatus Liberibacter europaeus]PTL86346.1 MAG: hypothetical protein C4617_03845 [Candidatus Liberibacter europaeus]
MNNRPWYKRYPADFISGVLGLTLEQKGAYCIILDLMYDRGGAIPDDEKYIAGVCGCSTRKWRNIRESLERSKKIFFQDGYIYNTRVEKEIIKAIKATEECQKNGRKGGIKSAKMRIFTNNKSNFAQASLKHARAFQKLENINQNSNYYSMTIGQKYWEESCSTNENNQIKNKIIINEEHWKKRLTWARRDGVWPTDWGPPPGQKGCLVPITLLKDNNKIF